MFTVCTVYLSYGVLHLVIEDTDDSGHPALPPIISPL